MLWRIAAVAVCGLALSGCATLAERQAAAKAARNAVGQRCGED